MMNRYTILILAMLLVLGMVGTAVAQEPVGGPEFSADALRPISGEAMTMISRFDLAAPWGVIDMQDMLPLQLALHRVLGTEVPWAWDLNHDGVVSIVDLGLVAARQGCTVVDACYWR
jgi:hypothetical protein